MARKDSSNPKAKWNTPSTSGGFSTTLPDSLTKATQNIKGKLPVNAGSLFEFNDEIRQLLKNDIGSGAETMIPQIENAVVIYLTQLNNETIAPKQADAKVALNEVIETAKNLGVMVGKIREAAPITKIKYQYGTLSNDYIKEVKRTLTSLVIDCQSALSNINTQGRPQKGAQDFFACQVGIIVKNGGKSITISDKGVWSMVLFTLFKAIGKEQTRANIKNIMRSVVDKLK